MWQNDDNLWNFVHTSNTTEIEISFCWIGCQILFREMCLLNPDYDFRALICFYYLCHTVEQIWVILKLRIRRSRIVKNLVKTKINFRLMSLLLKLELQNELLFFHRNHCSILRLMLLNIAVKFIILWNN